MFEREPTTDKQGDVAALFYLFLQERVEEMRGDEANVPDHWRAQTDPDTLFPGQCFPKAYAFVSSWVCVQEPPDRAVWMVVGKAIVGGIHCHAWVELPGDVVFDGTLQRFYHKRAYYEKQLAEAWYKYTPSAAMMLARYCPSGAYYWNWHATIRLPWADPANPMTLDREEVCKRLAAVGLGPGAAPKRPKGRSRKGDAK
jgi:hypothetical protein